MGPAAIRHRLACGRLHRLMPGVYAVGRPELTIRGRWMAAVLACGPRARLSHRDAASLWDLRKPRSGPVEIVIPTGIRRRRHGVRVHRRVEPSPPRDRVIDEIPVTDPVLTLVDLASCLPTGQLEAAINEADHLDLVNPEALRTAIDSLTRRPGARQLRTLLDAAAHAITSTELERRFLPLVREVGLPRPETQTQLGSHRVDFFWAELGLVVETDSLRYHRTAFKQGADKRRDNANARRALVTLRFSHGQVCYEPDYVRSELTAVARALSGQRGRLLRP